MRHHPSWKHRAVVLALALTGSVGVHAAGTICGMSRSVQENPADLENGLGDQSLEYAIDQPASIVTCAKGYLLEKCGDHENALKVFDKCIAAGYVGAMVWKALILQDGNAGPPDPEGAARLLHRAATSNDPAYAPIGKMHYATMLLLGKGVPKDEAAARRWFEAAAAEGSEEAREYLKTGYHTGYREINTALGAGTPPPGALVAGLTGDNASQPAAIAALAARIAAEGGAGTVEAPSVGLAPRRHEAANPPRPAASPATPEEVLPGETGQRLAQVFSAPANRLSVDVLWGGLLLFIAFFAGVLRQQSARFPRRFLRSSV